MILIVSTIVSGIGVGIFYQENRDRKNKPRLMQHLRPQNQSNSKLRALYITNKTVLQTFTQQHVVSMFSFLQSDTASGGEKTLGSLHLARQEVKVVGEGKQRRKIYLVETFRYIVTYWSSYWFYGLIIIGCSLSFKLFGTFFAYSLKVIIDSVTLGTTAAVILPIVGNLLIIFPVVVVLFILGQRLLALVAARIDNDIRIHVFEHLQYLSLDYYKQAEVGNIAARFTTDLKDIERGVVMRVLPGLISIVSLLINIPILFSLNWILALIALGIIPIVYPLLQYLTPLASEANYYLKRSEGWMGDAVQESVRAQPLIKSFGLQDMMISDFGQTLKQVEDRSVDAVFFKNLVELTVELSLLLSQLVVVCLGAILIIGGTLSSGSLVAFLVLWAIVNKDLYDIFRRTFPHLVSASGAIRRVEELLQEKPLIVDAPDALSLPSFSEEIHFDQISFTYTGDEQTLSDIDIRIKSGQFVAFVGSSGAGKSTILNLLMRFYDVSAGQLRFGEYDVREVTQVSLRKQIGVVLQDTFLFNSTILENIRIANTEATDEEIIAAAKAAELHEFVMSLPEGYKTSVGSEAGGRLSGGQRQRIGIARAIVRNPNILILDEPTSSLDAETAEAVNATIESLAGDRTLITTTHYLPSVIKADQIFVLDQGKIVERGTHQELITQRGLYTQMWQTQTEHGYRPKELKKEQFELASFANVAHRPGSGMGGGTGGGGRGEGRGDGRRGGSGKGDGGGKGDGRGNGVE